MSPAGAGIAAIVFNYDGSVYASDESRMLAEMGDQSFRLGNILTDSYEDIILSDALLDALEQSFTLSAPMCSDCALSPIAAPSRSSTTPFSKMSWAGNLSLRSASGT
ncbi:hypothetical protein P4234_29535 [Pseudomonas aeruginosa]|nr:hypothetical protein [Pseudomonas aeruginosa]